MRRIVVQRVGHGLVRCLRFGRAQVNGHRKFANGRKGECACKFVHSSHVFASLGHVEAGVHEVHETVAHQDGLCAAAQGSESFGIARIPFDRHLGLADHTGIRRRHVNAENLVRGNRVHNPHRALGLKKCPVLFVLAATILDGDFAGRCGRSQGTVNSDLHHELVVSVGSVAVVPHHPGFALKFKQSRVGKPFARAFIRSRIRKFDEIRESDRTTGNDIHVGVQPAHRDAANQVRVRHETVCHHIAAVVGNQSGVECVEFTFAQFFPFGGYHRRAICWFRNKCHLNPPLRRSPPDFLALTRPASTLPTKPANLPMTRVIAG